MNVRPYKVGDVVEFKDGGFGLVTECNENFNTKNITYHCNPLPGIDFGPVTKLAWYEQSEFGRLLFSVSAYLEGYTSLPSNGKGRDRK